RLELPARTLSSYERGNAFPSLNRAHTICRFYDAPMDFLFTGQGLGRVLNSKIGTMAQRRT
ncbi:helix-turn-helix domain-containing protein, partial [bacterium]|nr:helix-turn-helix domain-containing protein [bacterium]